MDDADRAALIDERAQANMRRVPITKPHFMLCQYCTAPSHGEEYCCEECRIDGTRLKIREKGKA